MSRVRVQSAAGVALSFLVALGGWALTNAMLDWQEAFLLSSAGSVRVESAPQAETGLAGGADGAGLAADVMARVVAAWNAPGAAARPHEPTEGQLNMEQAIAAAKDGLSRFAVDGIIPQWLMGDEPARTGAYLWEKEPTDRVIRQDSQSKIAAKLPPEYSYWTVTFDNNRVNVQLMLNAVTGEIWRADLFAYEAGTALTELEASDAVKAFAAYLGLGREGPVWVADTWASQQFEAGAVDIVVTKGDRQLTLRVSEPGLHENAGWILVKPGR